MLRLLGCVAGLCLLFGGGAFAQSPGQGEFIVAPSGPPVAFSQAQVDHAVSSTDWSDAPVTGHIDLGSIPRLLGADTLRDYKPSRAYAVGYPQRCGGGWHAWNFGSPAAAASAALSNCLKYREGWDKHVDQVCGCQLIIVDKRLIVDPAELAIKPRNPAIISYVEDGRDVQIFGTVESSGSTGENLPFRMFDAAGEQICSGAYSISFLEAAFGSGTFQSLCFADKVSVTGRLAIERVKHPHLNGTQTVGIARGKAEDGRPFELLFNVPSSRYAEFK